MVICSNKFTYKQAINIARVSKIINAMVSIHFSIHFLSFLKGNIRDKLKGITTEGAPINLHKTVHSGVKNIFFATQSLMHSWMNVVPASKNNRKWFKI